MKNKILYFVLISLFLPTISFAADPPAKLSSKEKRRARQQKLRQRLEKMQKKDDSYIKGANTFLLKTIQNVRKKSKNAKKRSVVMGIRGLDDAKGADAAKVEPNMDLLERMENKALHAVQSGFLSLVKVLKGKKAKSRKQVVMGIRGLQSDDDTMDDDVEPDYTKLDNLTLRQPQNNTTKPRRPMSPKETAKLQKELSIGRTIAAKLIGTFGLYENQQLLNYLNLIGLTIIQHSEQPGRLMLISVLDTDAVNAYAAPGGYIFVTRGALKKVASEDEMVAIIAHETGHVFGEHLLKQARQVVNEREKTSANSPITVKKRISVLSGESSNELLGNLMMMMGTNVGAIIFKQIVDTSFSLLLDEGISHQFEHEADAYAIQMTARMGYQRDALGHYLKRIKDPKRLGEVSKTHPPVAKRISKMKTLTVKNAPGLMRILTNTEFKKLWTTAL